MRLTVAVSNEITRVGGFGAHSAVSELPGACTAPPRPNRGPPGGSPPSNCAMRFPLDHGVSACASAKQARPGPWGPGAGLRAPKRARRAHMSSGKRGIVLRVRVSNRVRRRERVARSFLGIHGGPGPISTSELQMHGLSLQGPTVEPTSGPTAIPMRRPTAIPMRRPMTIPMRRPMAIPIRRPMDVPYGCATSHSSSSAGHLDADLIQRRLS